MIHMTPNDKQAAMLLMNLDQHNAAAYLYGNLPIGIHETISPEEADRMDARIAAWIEAHPKAIIYLTNTEGR